MNDKSVVSTANAPAAIGPYSQGVRLASLVYTSGQVALDPATGQMVPGGITEQTTRVLENVKAILAAAGSDLTRVVKTVVFLKDMNDFAAMNAVYAKYLAPEGGVAPARSTVEVSRLPKDALVEIETVATLPPNKVDFETAMREQIQKNVEERILERMARRPEAKQPSGPGKHKSK